MHAMQPTIGTFRTFYSVTVKELSRIYAKRFCGKIGEPRETSDYPVNSVKCSSKNSNPRPEIVWGFKDWKPLKVCVQEWNPWTVLL